MGSFGHMGIQIVDDIVEKLLLQRLVVCLVAGAPVQGDGHIPQPLRLQALVHLGDALAVIAYGVLIPGKEPYGQLLRDGGVPVGAVAAVNQLQRRSRCWRR